MVRIADAKSIGALVRSERRAQGLTQGELAQYSGLGVNFISQVERGKQTAEIGKVLQLLHVLGLELMGEKRSVWKTISRSIELGETTMRS